MPLQNRVDPFGALHADPARGLFTGNRGVIHDPATRTPLRRRWSTAAWLVCALDFKGRHREVMGRNARSGNAGWTEVFFLDEPTALAAGHRPCFHCRRAAANAFLAAAGSHKAPDLDAKLHGERLAAGATPHGIGREELATLPDGAAIASDGTAWMKRGGRFLPWSFAGYGHPVAASALPHEVSILTPTATLGALRGGYSPLWHPTAEAG